LEVFFSCFSEMERKSEICYGQVDDLAIQHLADFLDLFLVTVYRRDRTSDWSTSHEKKNEHSST
jgi:hypothetical protein